MLILIFLLTLLFPKSASAQIMPPAQDIEGQIISILEQRPVQVLGNPQTYQKLEIKLTSGQTITIDHGDQPLPYPVAYQVGDQLIISVSQDLDGQPFYFILDFVRRPSLLLLSIIFIVVTIIVGRLKGFSSLLSMAITFAGIFLFLIPQLLAGRDPILTSLLTSLFIIPITFYLSHGFNQKTTIALFSTIITLAFTAFLASAFINLSRLSGYSTEEAVYLQNIAGGRINIRGLLLASIIIGTLGILDDITISQAAIVQQLINASERKYIKKIYASAMSVGRDHIASMVNTLVLAYTGAALPLLLLFFDGSHTFLALINRELIAEEIIRTLVSSLGLILAVPLTTVFAAQLLKKEK